MTVDGRPVRFVAMTLGGWTAIRIGFVAMHASGPAGVLPPVTAPLRLVAQAKAAVEPASPPVRTPRGDRMPSLPMPVPRRERILATGSEGTGGGATMHGAPGAGEALAAADAFVEASHGVDRLAGFTPGSGVASPQELAVPPPRRAAASASRWTGSAWLLWRGDAPPVSRGALPRLGASQAGVRIDYAIAPTAPLSPVLYGRVSSALARPAAAEAAIGIALRPSALPVTIAVERRQALSVGGRSDVAVVVAGGLYERPVGAGFRIDGYAQAGVVGIGDPDAFVDGRLTLARPVLPGSGGFAGNLLLGAGLWGSAQPGAGRLDIGPQAGTRLRVGAATFRLGAEWRARVAGRARPESGPALTLAADF